MIYKTRIESIDNNIQIISAEYKLFCKVKDKNLEGKFKKEFSRSKGHFEDLYDHLYSELQHNAILYQKDVERLNNQVKLQIFKEKSITICINDS